MTMGSDPKPARPHRPLVEVIGLKCHFDVSAPLLNRLIEGKPRQTVRAVDGISFRIDRGKTYALVGESGCGKSTVAHLVVGLHPPTAGRVEFDGTHFTAEADRSVRAGFRRRMSMIFQDPYASLNPRWRVAKIVGEPIRAFGLLEGRRVIEQRVAQLLVSVGLSAEDGIKFPA
jgi:peptide/nickel transport system ATP-binding protein